MPTFGWGGMGHFKLSFLSHGTYSVTPGDRGVKGARKGTGGWRKQVAHCLGRWDSRAQLRSSLDTERVSEEASKHFLKNPESFLWKLFHTMA